MGRYRNRKNKLQHNYKNIMSNKIYILVMVLILILILLKFNYCAPYLLKPIGETPTICIIK